MSKVILNNCWDVSTIERKYDTEDAVQECFSELYMTGRLEMSVCCAASTKGHWKESWFCTEYTVEKYK